MKPISEIQTPLSIIFTPIVGEFRIKTYFSYYGIFKNNIMFALYKEEKLYLRTAQSCLEQVQNLSDTEVLTDPTVGLSTKFFYMIPQHLWQTENLAIWVNAILTEMSEKQAALATKQKSQIRSMANLNINIERMLKRIGIHSVEDFIDTGDIATFIKLVQIGIDGSDQLLFRLHGAIHAQNMYSFSQEKKLALLEEANAEFYKAGLRQRFRLPLK